MAADFHQNHLTSDDSTTFFAINLGCHQSECFSQKCKRGSLDSRKNRVKQQSDRIPVQCLEASVEKAGEAEFVKVCIFICSCD